MTGVPVPAAKVAPGLRTDPAQLSQTEKLTGRQARDDANTYRVWQKTDARTQPVPIFQQPPLGHCLLDLIDGVARERDGTGPTGRDRIEQMGRMFIAFDDKIHLELTMFDVK